MTMDIYSMITVFLICVAGPNFHLEHTTIHSQLTHFIKTQTIKLMPQCSFLHEDKQKGNEMQARSIEKDQCVHDI